jgi:transducin (beta)-like 1
LVERNSNWETTDTLFFNDISLCRTIHICSVSGSRTDAVAAVGGSTSSTSLRVLEGHLDEVNAISWSPTGTLLASCSDDTTAKVWSLSDGLVLDLRGHSKEIYTLRWTPCGPGSSNPQNPLYVCTASFDGTVRVWSAETGEVVYSLRRHAQPVYSVASCPTGSF